MNALVMLRGYMITAYARWDRWIVTIREDQRIVAEYAVRVASVADAIESIIETDGRSCLGTVPGAEYDDLQVVRQQLRTG